MVYVEKLFGIIYYMTFTEKKVEGRRGERKLRQVALRKNEIVSQEGHVITREDIGASAETMPGSQKNKAGKRSRSKDKSGHSPNMKIHRFGEVVLDSDQE